MFTKEIILNEERNVKLSAWIQDVGGDYKGIAKRPAILVIPGGAYLNCAGYEAEPVVFEYLRAGYQAFVLRYSLKDHAAWPNPLEDYEKAMDLIRNTAEWNVEKDKVAVVGFSAGGHLAACAATISKNKPNAALLGYAALSEEPVDLCYPKNLPIPVEHVDGNTAPCFLFAARDDSVVGIESTIEFEQALIRNDIMFESHIYAYGQHGFGTGDKAYVNNACNRVENWVKDSIKWLEDIFGVLTTKGLAEPNYNAKMNGNNGSNYSTECTVYYLLQQKGSIEELLSKVKGVVKMMETQLFGGADITSILKRMKLKDLLMMISTPENEIEKLDQALYQIPKK